MWTVPKAPDPRARPKVISRTTGQVDAVTFTTLKRQVMGLFLLLTLLFPPFSLDEFCGSLELAAGAGQRTTRTLAIHGSPVRR